MPLSTTFALVAFVSSAWAQLNMARCPAGFDWVSGIFGLQPQVVAERVLNVFFLYARCVEQKPVRSGPMYCRFHVGCLVSGAL